MGAGLTLIIGGARSGKSALAEKLTGRHERVLFVATAEALDDEMQRRIENHKRNRPTTWHTLEEPRAVTEAIASIDVAHDALLLDCLTLWVSNLLLDLEGQADVEKHIVAEAERLLAAYEASDAEWIVVTNEVGQGVVPPTVLGRAFQDALGRVNQVFAARADKVNLLVAGIAVDVKGIGGNVD
ncbi:MAG: bifunctional adenosylcobinamide kinase/adenosylcobinamide-phosphate guanylyltransferase [Chloroflexi bacterium]|nr:bifunctional adenosylcobinamide kinase/adenosylcobinamide-phosphate guanylyltransferase [Chloroflexota bacterium]